MAGENRGKSQLQRSTESFQENVERAAPAAGAAYTLTGAILVLGALGYAVDWWRGTWPWGLVIGLMLGIVIGMWELAKTVWNK
jgi:F0F1-type ATP synthase assembly protein I